MISRRLLTTTVVLAAVVLTTSLLGLLAPWAYARETVSWRLQGQGQDIGNLLAVLVLLAGAAAGRRGSRAGVQLWLGSLLYLAYAFVIYAFTVHFGALFLPYVAALGLASYTFVFGLAEARTATAPTSKATGAGWVITAVAALFALLWLGAIVPALASGQVPADLVEAGLVSNPVHVLDLALVLPGMVITASLARRGSSAARLLLVPWLAFSALMGASIVAALLLTGASPAPLAAVGIVTIVSAATAATTLRRAAAVGLRETLRVA